MVVNNNKKLAVFHNLSNGGAKISLNNINKILLRTYKVEIYNPKQIKFLNFLHYLKYVFFDLNIIQKNIAKDIDKQSYSSIIVYPDHLTKAPYLLRYLKTKSIYLCQEEPREFYQDKRSLSYNNKDKIVNFIRKPLKIVDNINVLKASVLLTNSKFSKKKLENIYKRKFQVVYPGVDNVIFKYSSLKREKYFLTIGSTSIFKGIDFIIKAIAKLPSNLRFKLIIIGNKGRDDDYINYLSAKYKVPFERKYSLTTKEVVSYYQNASLLLAAAVNEPFGLSLLESVSCGTKIIAINEGGYTEIFNTGNNIGKLTPRNLVLYANAIASEIDSIITKNNRDLFVNKWSWTLTVKKLEKFIT